MQSRFIRPVFLALALPWVLGSCGSDPLLPAPGDQIVIDFESPHDWPLDSWELQDARLQPDGGLVELDVLYTGGCRPHDFWFVAVDDWQMLPDAGPIPRIGVPTLLAHQDHGDPCEARVVQTLDFGLAPLVGAYRDRFGTGPAILLLRVPEGQGAVDTVTLDLAIPLASTSR